MSKHIRMHTSKKSRKHSVVAHRQRWNASANLVSREKKSTFYKEQDPEKVAAYPEKIKDIPKEKLVYVNETGIAMQMYRQYASIPRGQRVNISISGKRHKRIGLVGGQCKGKFFAPFTYSGTMRAPLFEQRFKYKLLKVLQKGRVIIMDSAAFHKKEVLHEIAQAHSQTLIFLPPYSPEHEPIEHAWSALKRNIASQVHCYGSVEEMIDAIL